MGVKMLHMKRITVLLPALFLLLISITRAQDNLKLIRSTVIENINGKDYYIHTVKKGQTLYMISKAYGADINEVIKENPEVKEGLFAEQKIKIPINKPGEQPKKTPKTPIPEAKEPKPEPPVETEAPCKKPDPGKARSYTVALMLPLELVDVPAMNVENNSSRGGNEYRSLRFIEFYEGFRIALDSLEKTGISLN